VGIEEYFALPRVRSEGVLPRAQRRHRKFLKEILSWSPFHRRKSSPQAHAAGERTPGTGKSSAVRAFKSFGETG